MPDRILSPLADRMPENTSEYLPLMPPRFYMFVWEKQHHNRSLFLWFCHCFVTVNCHVKCWDLRCSKQSGKVSKETLGSFPSRERSRWSLGHRSQWGDYRDHHHLEGAAFFAQLFAFRLRWNVSGRRSEKKHEKNWVFRVKNKSMLFDSSNKFVQKMLDLGETMIKSVILLGVSWMDMRGWKLQGFIPSIGGIIIWGLL